MTTPTPEPPPRPAKPSRLKRIAFLPKVEGNPYLRSLAGPMVEAGRTVAMAPGTLVGISSSGAVWRSDVVHIHWPHRYMIGGTWLRTCFKSIWFLKLLVAWRLMGKRIVWTAHNLADHEANFPRTQHFFKRRMIGLSRAVLAHSPACADAVAEHFAIANRKKLHVVPHAHYIDDYPQEASRDEARRRLGVEAGDFVYLFVGAIRGYKGVEEMIETFGQMSLAGARLVAAGKAADAATDARVRELAGRTPGVLYENAFVDSDQMQVYMAAADIVVLPYRKILTSGTLLLAASFGKAAIVPDAPTLLDTVDPAGVIPFDRQDDGALRCAMQAALDQRSDLPERGAASKAAAAKWGWPEMAAATLAAYDSLA